METQTATRGAQPFDARRFLVARQGPEVVIREIRPGSCACDFDRPAAFDFAQSLAQKTGPRPNHPATPERTIFFVALDGERRTLGTPTQLANATARRDREQEKTEFAAREAEQERAAYRAEMEAETEAETAGAAQADVITLRRGDAPVARDSELAQVVLDLRETNLAGRLNEWGASVLEQFERRGSLSPKQIAAGMRGIAAKQARQAARAEQPAREPLPVVPTGRYAVDSEAQGELRFYRVYRTQTGRTELYVLHGGNESQVPFSWDGYRTILQSIVDAGPAEAAIRYGREVGRCSRCHTRLTNRLSRELAIGPICGGHWHEKDEWTSKKAAAREAIRARGEDPDEDCRVGVPDHRAGAVTEAAPERRTRWACSVPNTACAGPTARTTVPRGPSA